MKIYRVILLGLGFWGTNWMRTLNKIPICQVVAVAGSKRDIERISKEYSIPKDKAYTDYKSAIGEVNADIVIIVIPTKYHTAAAKLALKKGMHVLSEKPLAATLAEAKEIIEFKKKYPGQKYMVDQNYRWRPHNQTIKRAIAEGLIGKIGSIHIEFRQPEDLLGYREFLEMPLLQDASIHHFDLMRFFTSKRCKEIFARSFRPIWSKFTGMPATEAIITMEDGILINYNATWATRGRETSWDGNITVMGSKGCLALDKSDTVRFFASGSRQGKILEKVNMEYTELDYAIHMFTESIEKNWLPESSLEENYGSFAMVCAAEESVRKNLPVKIV